MSIWRFFFWCISVWFLFGSIAAYWNFYLVEKRKAFLDALQRLRQELWQYGILSNFEPKEWVKEIGFDEDMAADALKSSPIASSLTVDTTKFFLAIAITIYGPLSCRGCWLQWKDLYKLRQAHVALNRANNLLIQALNNHGTSRT